MNSCDTVAGAPVAQSEEQLTFNQRVPGSKPGGGTRTLLPLRIRRKIRFAFVSDQPVAGPCWVWTGSIHRAKGYGQSHYGGKKWLIHRLTYSLLVGPIPDGLEIDHLCRVRHCCNPGHLEPVTSAVNQQRGKYAHQTHCKRGHPLTGWNLIEKRGPSCGKRQCRTCMYASQRRSRAAEASA